MKKRQFANNISRQQLEDAFDYADFNANTDGDPTTVWE